MAKEATKKATVKKEATKKAEPKKEIVEKALLFRHSKDGKHQEIYFEGGGEVPAQLLGKWTNSAAATTAIAGYKANK